MKRNLVSRRRFVHRVGLTLQVPLSPLPPPPSLPSPWAVLRVRQSVRPAASLLLLTWMTPTFIQLFICSAFPSGIKHQQWQVYAPLPLPPPHHSHAPQWAPPWNSLTWTEIRAAAQTEQSSQCQSYIYICIYDSWLHMTIIQMFLLKFSYFIYPVVVKQGRGCAEIMREFYRDCRKSSGYVEIL